MVRLGRLRARLVGCHLDREAIADDVAVAGALVAVVHQETAADLLTVLADGAGAYEASGRGHVQDTSQPARADRCVADPRIDLSSRFGRSGPECRLVPKT